ncbi:MAG: DUF748 domain-containing protein [Burkholderiales bacterium]|nr:DUF748 domain-containing protein [Burkholderiales bacterium]
MQTQISTNSPWRRRLAWALAGLVVVWAVGWLAVPPILKSQAEKMAGQQLGRKVSIGAVDFKPWTLELTVTDLAVATADGTGEQLKIGRIYIDSELESLLRLAPVVDALTVDTPTLHITHLGDGHYDIDDILARLNQPGDQPPGAPPRFALYNLALNGGAVDFTDQAVGRTHELRGLDVSVPFLSNLASQREVKVAPRLAFRLNGSVFDSAAEGTPFAQTRKTDAAVRISGLNLAPYLGYLPASLPVRLQSAVLGGDLKLAFEQTPQTIVRLSGTLQADDVVVTNVPAAGVKGALGGDLLAFKSLQLTLDDVQPLARRIKLSKVALESPVLAVRRDAAGRLNLALAAEAAGPDSRPRNATEKVANNDHSTGGEGQKSTQTAVITPATPWAVEVAQVALRAGLVRWSDASTPRPAEMALKGLTLDASGIAWPLGPPLQFSGAGQIDGAAAADGASAANLRFTGQATDRMATVTASVGPLPLSLAGPYLASFLAPVLSGEVQADLAVNWTAAEAGRDAALTVQAKALSLDDLALRAASASAVKAAAGTHAKGAASATNPTAKVRNTAATLASVQKIDLTDAQIDVTGQSVTVARLAVTRPMARVERDADGRWMFERWLKNAGPPAAAPVARAASGGPSTASGAAVPPPAPAWKVLLSDVSLVGGVVGYADRATPKPVEFEVSSLKVALKNFSPDGRKPSPLTVSARVGAGQTEPGRVDYQGNLALAPLSAAGQVQIVRLPVHAFEPYFGNTLNIELLRADASFKGRVRYADGAAGPSVDLAGDTALEDLRANSVPVSAPASGTNTVTANPTLWVPEEILSWKALSLRGLAVSLAPGTATSVAVAETALSDFFARVIIDPTGRINLQDLVKPSAAPGTAAGATPTTAAAAGATATAAIRAVTPTAAMTPPGTATVAATVPSGPAPRIDVGPISLVNGKVLFSDRFVRPNYTANLSELTGRLSAFSSVSPTGSPPLADLELRGRAEGTASLEILGQLNPLAQPLALDISAKVRDLELPPLSPYAIKYAGYGIERGKLSVDVAYKVQPDGQLTASNNLVLNQLSFGDKVEGAPASLPVKLAVALLADRNGVIDINLPISGSLNDPQFRLGPVIFKVIVNLIAKAITSPFSLLASAFGGGGDELSTVKFAPGSAVLAADARAGLDKVAKALSDRPALTMTVVGTASLQAEREGYKRERLNALVQAEKRRAALAAGQTPTAAITLAAAEYPALLKEVYRRADMPKPRNLIGLAKDLPGPEMEALLLASIPVTDDAMRELALQRGVAVKDYLASRQLPVERLFLGAAKAVESSAAGAGKGGVAAAEGWSPRAELSLKTR